MTASRQAIINRWHQLLGILGIYGVAAVLGMLMMRDGPTVATLGWIVYFAGIAAILYQPRYGIYLTVFFTLVGDGTLLWWYPFVKNFSSGESILFLHNALIISPLETYIGLTFVSWLGRLLFQRRFRWYAGALTLPSLLFITFITIALAYGLLTGGDLVIALWESRFMYYLPAMLILVSNLVEERTHTHTLLWWAMAALFIEGLNGSWFVANTLQFDLGSVERIAEHSLSIHANSLFVLLISVWLFGGSYTKRIGLLPMLPFVALTYFANQRRAAFVTLAVALIVIAIVLFIENRRLFFLIAPPLGLVALVYLAAFWNSSGALGMPASAIKSVVAPDATSGADQSSNLYRLIENLNTSFNIHNTPITGVGFGKKFIIAYPMPDISFAFIWWEYITHNSVLWVWMKAGICAFLSLIFLIGLALMTGARAVYRMPDGNMRAVALTATLYVMMHFIFAYVDMSWEPQSMVYVGTMMGLINVLERVVAKPLPGPEKRWPWQQDKPPTPGLRPL